MKDLTKIVRCLLATATVFAVLCASNSWAQEEFDDAELTTFVRTQLQISQLQQHYANILAQTPDAGQQQAIMQQANQEIMGILESEGLSLDRYNAIAEETQGNPELQQRLNNIMMSLQQ